MGLVSCGLGGWPCSVTEQVSVTSSLVILGEPEHFDVVDRVVLIRGVARRLVCSFLVRVNV